MKKLLLALAALAIAAPVLADIPEPIVKSDITLIEGADAIDLYDVLDVDAKVEGMLRTGTLRVKVFRAESGLTQIVCHTMTSRVGKKVVNGDCVIEKSRNGQPLPEYVFRRIVG